MISIIMTGEKADLKNILSNGDLLNHSIFSADELNFGLSKLISNGYIEIVDDKIFKATRKALDFYNKNKKPFKGIIAELMGLSAIFYKLPVEVVASNCTKFYSQADVDQTYWNYLGPIKRIIIKIAEWVGQRKQN